ncbi:hypothetical protein EVJ58_g2485 [Rhodofomes roseus]|nr:hypothetical protein EVJ58_g2485 [Rhodofomes roseus]
MQTQLLETIGRSPPKRPDDWNSDIEMDDARRARKKRKADPNEILAEILRGDEGSDFDEDDMALLGGDVDPNTLCPWCDERLPPAPSPHLESLIAAARRSSTRDPRPVNALGLRAPVGTFVSVCQRHRFESHQIPKAQARGWPTKIDWDSVAPRVKALRAKLQEIIDDVDEDFLPGAHRADDAGDDDVARWSDRPRKGSTFWRDVVKSVRKSGSRKTAGVAGQLANFSKTQPGYYGELGYVIIHQTMYDMFPPASFPPESTLPLNSTDFIQLILIPEAVVSLIMEDMYQTREEAIETLRDSAEYGVAMFPDDQAEGADAVDQGERIIMRRAEARRRELAVEDRLEKEMLQTSSQGVEPLNGRPKPRRRAKQPEAAATEPDSEKSDVEVGPVRPSKKGKERGMQSRDHTDCEASAVDDGHDAGRRMTRSQSRARSIQANSDIEMDVSDNAPSTSKPLSRPKPKPRRKRPEDSHARLTTDDLDLGELEMDGVLPPSVPQPIPEVHWDAKGHAHLSRAGSMVDEDPTPRASKISRPTDRASKETSIPPLQRARDRRAKT